MTPAPLVVEEKTNLEDAAKLLSFLFFSAVIYFFISLSNLSVMVTLFSNISFLFPTRILLETKYRRLPVVDSDGKLVREIYIYRSRT